MAKKTFLILMILSLLLNSCSPTSCDERNKEYVMAVENLLADWDTRDKEAQERYEAFNSISNRILLFDSIVKLGNVANQAYEMDSPSCAEEVHEALTTYILWEMEGYYAIIADLDEQYIEDTFTKAQEKRNVFNQLWNDLTLTEPQVVR